MLYYSVDDGDRQKLDDSRDENHPSVNVHSDYWQPRMAEECAQSYHDYGGWEEKWPVIITLYESMEGPEIARYRVEREYDPIFYAEQIEGEGNVQLPEA
jgi:hypothetical protein